MSASANVGPWQIEVSGFRGREPDEDRLDLDLGLLHSVAFLGSWTHHTLRAQTSIGRFNEPHSSEPGDVTRITASVEHVGDVPGRPGAITLAFGQNRETFAIKSAWLIEATRHTSQPGTVYLRGEVADKHILEAGGLHPPGLQHPHLISRVSALTLGYQHALWRRGGGSAQWLALGADATGHLVPDELKDAYGRPLSIHVYLRFNVTTGSPCLQARQPEKVGFE